VALEDIPARAPQIGRRIEVGIEREQPLVNHAGSLGPEGRNRGVREKEESGQQTTVIHGELKNRDSTG
jgi:hypothetical protein